MSDAVRSAYQGPQHNAPQATQNAREIMLVD